MSETIPRLTPRLSPAWYVEENKRLTAEIASLRAQLDEARRKAISECIEIAEAEIADPKSSGRSIAKRLRDLLGG